MLKRGAQIILVVLCALMIYFLAQGNLIFGFAIAVVPMVMAGMIIFFKTPFVGLMLTLVWAFIGLGIKRYIPSDSGSALGLGVDILLVATWLVYFIRNFHYQFDSKSLKNGLMYATLVWLGYNVFEILNPEAPTFIGWFYAGRGVFLYMILVIPLTLIVVKEKKQIDWFVMVWFGLSVAGVLWGMKQLYVGLDYGELLWLSEPGNRSTHLLFGKLRVFSFYSDSGQFGASMGHACIVAIVLAAQSVGKKRFLFGFLGLIFFYGLMISGTRGAIAVPVVGGIAFLLMKKNFSLILIGVSIMALSYGTLKYTSIGSGIYEVQRMRTALDPNNPSLLVRVENQKKLFEYLKSHPLGGGVGSAGYWGLRFNPYSFLANLALDSWYVKIAAEQGFPGLALFIGFVLYVLIEGYRRIGKVQDAELQKTLIAFYAGIAGIAVASYGNQVWGQMPTGIILYISMAIIWTFSAPES